MSLSARSSCWRGQTLHDALTAGSRYIVEAESVVVLSPAVTGSVCCWAVVQEADCACSKPGRADVILRPIQTALARREGRKHRRGPLF